MTEPGFNPWSFRCPSKYGDYSATEADRWFNLQVASKQRHRHLIILLHVNAGISHKMHRLILDHSYCQEIRGYWLTRGLAPKVQPGAFSGQRHGYDKDGRPQEDVLVVHCFCICGGGAVLEGHLGMSIEQVCGTWILCERVLSTGIVFAFRFTWH